MAPSVPGQMNFSSGRAQLAPRFPEQEWRHGWKPRCQPLVCPQSLLPGAPWSSPGSLGMFHSLFEKRGFFLGTRNCCVAQEGSPRTTSCWGRSAPWRSWARVHGAEPRCLLRRKTCSSTQHLSPGGERGFLGLLRNCDSFWQSELSLPFWNPDGPLDSDKRGCIPRGVQCCYFPANGSLQWPNSRLWGHVRNVPAGSRRRARGPCVRRQAAKAAPRPGGVYGGPGREGGPAPRRRRAAAAAAVRAAAAAVVAATAGRAAWPWWRRPPALTCRAPGRGRRRAERGASALSAAKVVRAAGRRRRPRCCHTPISPGGSRGGRLLLS